MKTRTLILVSIFLLSVTFSFAGGEDKISKKVFWNAMSGTWVNTDYLGNTPWYEQKLIIHTDGKFGYYPLTTDTNPIREGYYFTLTEAWIDSEGITWYKAIRKEPGGDFHELGKISDSGNRWEFIADAHNEPTEWDTTITRYEWYEIRYREK